MNNCFLLTFKKIIFKNVNTLRLLSHSLCCRFIHLIKETNTWDMVLLGLVPHSLSLRLLEDLRQQKHVYSEHACIDQRIYRSKGQHVSTD